MSQELVRSEPRLTVPAELISDDEIRRLYRIAESLSLSRMFKDVQSAEQAFAKMIIGRDLGMSPAQSMQGLHIVEGAVTVHYAMLGQFIRARAEDGYDYRTGWLKQNPGSAETANRELVWATEDDPTDDREVVGAVAEFTVNGELRGVSRYTLEDAQRAGLIKDSAKAAWNTSRRNMFMARAMSNGVKWYVPEVMGGLPIYAEGEIVPENSITAPVGDGPDEGQGLELGPKVDAIIERATKLGHAGLSNRGALEVALGNRAPAVVNKWLADAKAELDRFEANQNPDAAAEEAADGEAIEVHTPTAPEPVVIADAEEVTEPAPESPETELLKNRLAALEGMRGEEQDPENRRLLDEEINVVETALRERGVS